MFVLLHPLLHVLKHGIALLLFLWVMVLPALAQHTHDHERCGTVPFNRHSYHNKGISAEEIKSRFESWMNDKKQDLRQRSLHTQGTSQTEPVLTIPVVVHVIHRGENLGEGSNIPYEQVIDQIDILNEDFRRLNPDRDETLPIFQDVAADVRIEFVLARQSPEGFATNGVTRTEGSQQTYGINSATTLSNLSLWPPEDYFNMWVAPLGNGLLGYAQFPVSDLPGLEGAITTPATDGIVIDYRYFGSTGNVAPSSRGRTTTHEVGHYLGLRHIWGDGDCSADDFVEDTPLQESDSDGCPIDPFSCGSPDMFQNYMDYTTDVCMNLFTLEQKERMRIVLENSPRRASLLISPGLTEPMMVENDAAIARIIEPKESTCSNLVTPTISLTNTGTNAINTVSVSLFLQGNLVGEQQANVNLQTGEETTLSFTTLDLTPGNMTNNALEMSFQISQVNGSDDNNSSNNFRRVDFIIPQRGALPLSENFEVNADTSLVNQGIIQNPDQLIGWNLVGAPGFGGPDNQALYLNFYDYENGIGESDFLYSPVYDFSNLRDATLSLRYAYAPYTEGSDLSEDRFIIGISTDCGATIEETLFDAAGIDLATASPSNAPFSPQSRAEWQQLEFSLNDYVGNPNVVLVFTGINDWGNNLYLDDVEISIDEINNLDIAIEEVLSPARISCISNPTPAIRVRNEGSSTINTFEVSYQIDNLPMTSFANRDFPLQSEESEFLTFETLDLSPGRHTLSVQVSEPNLLVDEDPSDNFRTFTFYIDDQQDVIPLVQEFNEGGNLPDILNGSASTNERSWMVVNPDGATTWQTVPASGNGFNNNSAFINLFDYQNVGTTDMLVSPVLDFSSTDEASVFFKVSYALLSESYADTLRLKVSTNCGLTYETVYERAGADLAILQSDNAWNPQSAEDWRQEFVNLSSFAGATDVRVAFEVVNAYGNNLYLDDIEFYTSSDDSPVAQKLDENSYRIFPNPYNPSVSIGGDGYLKMAFNLRAREDVRIQLLDSRGKLLSDELYPFTLNQTYQFDLLSLPTGMYIFRVISNSINTTRQLLKQ
jgi:hypothetical protein